MEFGDERRKKCTAVELSINSVCYDFTREIIFILWFKLCVPLHMSAIHAVIDYVDGPL